MYDAIVSIPWGRWLALLLALQINIAVGQESPSKSWLFDFRTGKLTDEQLRGILDGLQDAAAKPAAARQAELDRSYRRFSSQFPAAPEVDLLYACVLISANHTGVAKSHLAKKVPAELSEYWPARRLALYLASSSDTPPVLAKKLSAFATTLAAREVRPEVLAHNAQWMGLACEALRLSAPESPEVLQAVANCEQALSAQTEALARGKAVATQLANVRQAAIEAATQKLDARGDEVQEEIEGLKKGVEEKQAELKMATETLTAANQQFETTTAPLKAAAASLSTSFDRAMTEVADARRNVQSAESDLRREQQDLSEGLATSRDVDRVRDRLDDRRRELSRAEDKARGLQRQYQEVDNRYQQIARDFNKQYAAELRITSTRPKQIVRESVKVDQQERTRKAIENRKSISPWRTVDFLRPDIEAILAEVVRKDAAPAN